MHTHTTLTCVRLHTHTCTHTHHPYLCRVAHTHTCTHTHYPYLCKVTHTHTTRTCVGLHDGRRGGRGLRGGHVPGERRLLPGRWARSPGGGHRLRSAGPTARAAAVPADETSLKVHFERKQGRLSKSRHVSIDLIISFHSTRRRFVSVKAHHVIICHVTTHYPSVIKSCLGRGSRDRGNWGPGWGGSPAQRPRHVHDSIRPSRLTALGLSLKMALPHNTLTPRPHRVQE